MIMWEALISGVDMVGKIRVSADPCGFSYDEGILRSLVYSYKDKNVFSSSIIAVGNHRRMIMYVLRAGKEKGKAPITVARILEKYPFIEETKVPHIFGVSNEDCVR